jgi:hypothetical protein
VRAQLPLLTRWAPVPLPEPSVLEALAVPRSLRYVYDVARGGHTGPTIEVYVFGR